ncbi:hypothetical protein GCM10007063_29680 [Lentibacillus kapialis]|uniref:VWFA domain-containing protein n=1 Tax=Lentibacillus kapialis TaxID=340214 RepID=A0A917V0L7_9BACI|nr:VWA domain-containing protein [Lentibacillus kapialis]GGK05331.1 hypothetical protein GCM10007063_29680 [Lentibacillus kapialis]
MKHVRWIIILMSVIAVILSGCSNDAASTDGQEKEKSAEKEEPNIPEAANNAEEMADEGPGKLFTTGKMGTEKLDQELEALPENVNAEEAYNYLTYLMAADYDSALKKYEEFDPTFTMGDAPANGDSDETQEEEKKKQHVALLMDASGSMGGHVNGEVKMTAAKDALKQFVSDLPEDAQVMLRVYGHKGTGSDADKEMSCNSSEVVYPLDTYDRQSFDSALSEFEPAGWTPLAASVKAAEKDLKKQSGDNTKSIVYIISDGEETCGGDPVKAASQLHESGIAAAVNIIGFDVGNKAQEQLREVAEAGGGEFTNVKSSEDMLEAAENNISEALQTAEMNMWSAMESTDIRWDAIHKKDDVDAIASEFDDVIAKEHGLYMDGFERLQESEKISEETADKLRERIEKREEKLLNFNDGKRKELRDKVEDERQKTIEMIDEKREKSSE